MKTWFLALASASLLACIAVPPPLPSGSDPGNPRAAEVLAASQSDLLRSDPPPPAALEPPSAGSGMPGGMDMENQSTEESGDSAMQDHGAGMHMESDAGMHHQHRETGARDGGSP